MGQKVISDGIPAVPLNRKFSESVPNPSVEEKTTRNYVPWNNKKQTLGIPFRTLQQKTKQLGSPFRGTKIEANSWNSVLNHSAKEKQLRTKSGSGSLRQFSN
jgi:hypothetical protein